MPAAEFKNRKREGSAMKGVGNGHGYWGKNTKNAKPIKTKKGSMNYDGSENRGASNNNSAGAVKRGKGKKSASKTGY